MPIQINFQEAVKLFKKNLKQINTTDIEINRCENALQHSFKRLIANQLKIYPLTLKKVKKIYSPNQIAVFSYLVKKFNSLINNNAHLQYVSFKEIFDNPKKLFPELSNSTIKNIKKQILKIVTLDLDDFMISQIPEKVIYQCMVPSKNFVHASIKRFLTFLMHRNLLDKKYLYHHKKKFIQTLENLSNLSTKNLNIKTAYLIFLKYLYQKKCLNESALRAIHYHIKSFAEFINSNRLITSITKDEIICYLNYLELKRGYSQRSKSCILGYLRGFFGHFIKQNTIKYNPTNNIKIKIICQIEKNILKEEELTLIFKAAYLQYKKYEDVPALNAKQTLYRWIAARDWAIISLLICTGMRTKEIASLKINSVDLKARIVKIKGKGDSQYKIKERIIPVTEPIVLGALEKYLELRPVSGFLHLFINYYHYPLKPPAFLNAIHKITKKVLKERRINITQIRKSFITLCAEKGIDPLVLKQVMGHSSLLTTMKYYLTVQEQHLKKIWEQNNPLNYFKKKEFDEWII